MRTLLRFTLAAALAVSAVPALAEGQARDENPQYGAAMKNDPRRASVTEGRRSDAPAEGKKAPASHDVEDDGRSLPRDPFNRSMDAA